MTAGMKQHFEILVSERLAASLKVSTHCIFDKKCLQYINHSQSGRFSLHVTLNKTALYSSS